MASLPEVDVVDTTDLMSQSGEHDESSRCGGRCRRWRTKDWFFVELVVIAHCLSHFPVNIVTQKYALDWISSGVFNSTSSESWEPTYIPSPCDPNISDYELLLSNRAQSLTSLYLTVKSIVWGVPALVMTILLGAGSDRLGRRYQFSCSAVVTRHGTGSLGHRVNGSFRSCFTPGSPGHHF